MAIATKLKAQNVTKDIASSKAPIRTTSTVEWGCACPLGTLSANVSITLPNIDYSSVDYLGDIEITALQPAAGSYTITLTVYNTASQTITDGDTSGTSLVITPTASSFIEINALPISTTEVSVLSVETGA